MILVFILYFLIAVLDWVAVAKGWKKVEYIAKPAAMLVLLGPLVLLASFGSVPLICFSLGIFFSLVGDVFLMLSYARFSDRWFIPGLAAFLLAHVTYIIGLNIPMPDVSPLWSLGLGVILALTAARLLRRILAGVSQKGLGRLIRPVALYGMTITLMLLSALLTLFSSWWNAYAAALVSSGAILFYFSDTLLAWNKFVAPVKNGRLVNMILYHLGQFALVAGVILQFGK
jgi:alkenylglycerophosphocholine/alkenylglycerophosphoethanolamine hydrolase